MKKSFRWQGGALFLWSILLTACSPRLDWRTVQGSSEPYSVLLPAKPSTLVRRIDLAGTPVTMTMTAAEVDDVTFAVGSLALPDSAQAQQAIVAMKTAMLKNIRGKILHESSASDPSGSHIEVEAIGSAANGRPRLLVAHFVAHGKFAYQAVVTGTQVAVTRDQVDTFMSSFKPQ